MQRSSLGDFSNQILSSARSRRVLILLIVGVAVVYALTLKNSFTYSDEADYYWIAYSLLHRHAFTRDGFHPTAFRPPGFPATLVPILALNEAARFAKAFNLLCWVGTALLTAHLAGLLYGSAAETLALLMVLLYPVGLYTAGTLYPQMVTGFVFLLSTAMHFRPRARASWTDAVLQGLAFAYLILCVPLYAANLAILMAFQAMQGRAGILRAVVTGAIVAAALSLWCLRNYSTYGQFAFTSNSGVNLLLGNSPLTHPDSGTNVDIAAIAPEAVALPEMQQDAALKRHATDWMKEHPRAWAVLFVEKLGNWFNYRNQLATSGESSRLRDLAVAVTYYPLLALGLLPLMRRRRLSELESYLLLNYAGAAVAYAFFFTRIRFRVPFDFLLMILASGSLTMLLRLSASDGGAGRDSSDKRERYLSG